MALPMCQYHALHTPPYHPFTFSVNITRARPKSVCGMGEAGWSRALAAVVAQGAKGWVPGGSPLP